MLAASLGKQLDEFQIYLMLFNPGSICYGPQYCGMIKELRNTLHGRFDIVSFSHYELNDIFPLVL